MVVQIHHEVSINAGVPGWDATLPRSTAGFRISSSAPLRSPTDGLEPSKLADACSIHAGRTNSRRWRTQPEILPPAPEVRLLSARPRPRSTTGRCGRLKSEQVPGSNPGEGTIYALMAERYTQKAENLKAVGSNPTERTNRLNSSNGRAGV